ncbi:MAG: fumarylacetoacetate hydrolase family protein [Alphaproteobacteria bacterium]
MRLARLGDSGQEIPVIIDGDGGARDARRWVDDWAGAALDPENLRRLETRTLDHLPVLVTPGRFGPCVARIGKIVGVALNYRMHAVETGAKLPSEPHIFMKATSALAGAHDPITMPPTGVKLDWEVELGVVIGRTARNVTAAEALDYVAGYCLLDDVSERAFQLERGGAQHTKGKSADSFCPLGPWLLTADEGGDPQNIALWTKINGVTMQNGTTAQMLHPVAALIATISEFMTLNPGDVIATGTPDGVGKGMNPPCYLKVGDVVTLGGAGLGEQRHQVVMA